MRFLKINNLFKAQVNPYESEMTKGRHQNSLPLTDKNLQGNMCSLIVRLVWQVTKRHFTICLGFGITMPCVDRGPRRFCEMSAMVTNWSSS